MRAYILRRGLLSAATIALAALSVVSFRSAASAGTTRVVAAGTFSAPFSGVGAEGQDLLWIGPASGGIPGEMVIRLADKGAAIDSNQPTWAVNGIVFVSGAPEDSFAAEVDGKIDWRRGTIELRGRITVGHLKGAVFEQTGEIRDLDVRGQWRAERLVAAK
jgi:hypothetical protein